MLIHQSFKIISLVSYFFLQGLNHQKFKSPFLLPKYSFFFFDIAVNIFLYSSINHKNWKLLDQKNKFNIWNLFLNGPTQIAINLLQNIYYLIFISDILSSTLNVSQVLKLNLMPIWRRALNLLNHKEKIQDLEIMMIFQIYLVLFKHNQGKISQIRER
ncbi:hypothetical protein pb186bvf_009949 [Paramecium bursaria]